MYPRLEKLAVCFNEQCVSAKHIEAVLPVHTHPICLWKLWRERSRRSFERIEPYLHTPWVIGFWFIVKHIMRRIFVTECLDYIIAGVHNFIKHFVHRPTPPGAS